MTDQHLTTSQLLARHDAAKRADATTAGRPLDRTHAPGLAPAKPVGSVIFTRDGDLCVAHAEGPVTPLDFAGLRAALEYGFTPPPRKGEPAENLDVTVVADMATFKALVKQAARWAARKDTLEATHMARLLAYRAGLPWSAYLPVLTEGLASRYWLPANLGTDSVADWCTAFGMTPSRDFHTFARLLAKATQRGTDRVPTKYLTAAERAERYSSNSARSAADHSASAAFNGAGLITDAHAAVIATDTRLLERNRIAGTVSAVRIVQVRAKYVEALVTSVGKLRSDSRILAFTAGGSTAEATLGEVSFRNDSFSVKILAEDGVIRGRTRQDGNPLLRVAHEQHETIYVTAAPFLMVKKRPKNRRWSNNFDGEAKQHPVDIPADVALAGAPMEAAG